MDATRVIGVYYDAWKNKKGDMTGVPLADDMVFKGPIVSFTDAAGFTQMAAEAGAAVTAFEVRRQFTDGSTICSIVDWQMAMLPGEVLTSAEILEVEDGQIVRGELIYDAESLRKVMAS
ncbi:nuclear transport factor 2 family protein [Jiangella alkaliphila]|uniref:SnoaL-like domain-containing protein n=1 Tax=Jiangella alkaliphila TaxID=419479 RepID=A0A1H2L731_9ACTN|nr:nuclear transport factor 2 family protein [Jiangella alkaliphila]SDU76612.1 SnoaL-like domain-containing protein [Jiangella alkaliphila]